MLNLDLMAPFKWFKSIQDSVFGAVISFFLLFPSKTMLSKRPDSVAETDFCRTTTDLHDVLQNCRSLGVHVSVMKQIETMG